MTTSDILWFIVGIAIGVLCVGVVVWRAYINMRAKAALLRELKQQHHIEIQIQPGRGNATVIRISTDLRANPAPLLYALARVVDREWKSTGVGE